mgnify:CR=1 FL=1
MQVENNISDLCNISKECPEIRMVVLLVARPSTQEPATGILLTVAQSGASELRYMKVSAAELGVLRTNGFSFAEKSSLDVPCCQTTPNKNCAIIL